MRKHVIPLIALLASMMMLLSGCKLFRLPDQIYHSQSGESSDSSVSDPSSVLIQEGSDSESVIETPILPLN